MEYVGPCYGGYRTETVNFERYVGPIRFGKCSAATGIFGKVICQLLQISIWKITCFIIKILIKYRGKEDRVFILDVWETLQSYIQKLKCGFNYIFITSDICKHFTLTFIFIISQTLWKYAFVYTSSVVREVNYFCSLYIQIFYIHNNIR